MAFGDILTDQYPAAPAYKPIGGGGVSGSYGAVHEYLHEHGQDHDVQRWRLVQQLQLHVGKGSDQYRLRSYGSEKSVAPNLAILARLVGVL